MVGGGGERQGHSEAGGGGGEGYIPCAATLDDNEFKNKITNVIKERI